MANGKEVKGPDPSRGKLFFQSISLLPLDDDYGKCGIWA